MNFRLPSHDFEPRVYGVGAWTDLLYLAYDLVTLLRPRVIVELGTDRGESYFAFCQAVAEGNAGALCFAVDTWLGDSHAGSYDESTFALVEKHNRSHYAGFSKLLRSTFDGALDNFKPEGIDLLHLDGLHSEEAVRHDLANWLPKLRPGGLLLLHDVSVRTRGFGVWKLWDELQASGRHWTIELGPGLGIWQKQPNEPLPAPFEEALSGDRETQGELYGYYLERSQALRHRIAKEWSNGAVRQLDFLDQTVIQVFYTSDGVHSEEHSVNVRVGHGLWKEVVIDLPAGAGAAPLRIDFVSPWTTIDISQLSLTDEGDVLFAADNSQAFDQIVVKGDVRRLLHTHHLLLQITGIDPQLYLPAIVAHGKLVLKLCLQVSSTISNPGST